MLLSRRAFLTTTVVAGAAPLLAACSANPSAPAPSAAAATTPPAPAAPTAVLAKPVASAAPTAAPAAPAPTAAPAVATRAPTVAVKAAWVAKTANQMIWPLAKDAGYFEKYGLAVDLNYINGSSVAIPAFFANDLDVASVAGSAVIGAQAASQDIVMVAGFLNQAVFRVMSIDLHSIDEVKGKSVAVTRIGNADYYAWQTILERQHWNQDDVTFVNSGDTQGQVGLMQQGNVAAIAVSPPNDVLASKIGARMILDTATLQEPEQNVGFAVSRAYLASHRPVVTAMVKASVEAMARWKKDAPFTKGVIQKYLDSTDPDFTNVGYEAYAPVWPKAPYPSRDGMLTVIQEVASQNPKAKDVDVDRTMDTSIIKELEDSGFINSIYGS
ncbi:MAG: hypothetical protein NVSMB2_07530 [Chloroflexota bacterium]